MAMGRNGVIQTGIGPVEVQRIKVRDRAAGPAAERIRFSSALLPRWARRTTSLDALLPILYLRGVSAGDFQEALIPFRTYCVVSILSHHPTFMLVEYCWCSSLPRHRTTMGSRPGAGAWRGSANRAEGLR